MKLNTLLSSGLAALVLIVSGCSSQNKACEDVTQKAEQAKECQILQRKITQAKDNPIAKTELERRYQENCTNIRYYRDDKVSAVCANKQKIKEFTEQAEK